MKDGTLMSVCKNSLKTGFGNCGKEMFRGNPKIHYEIKNLKLFPENELQMEYSELALFPEHLGDYLE